jgi:hypothetical protein
MIRIRHKRVHTKQNGDRQRTRVQLHLHLLEGYTHELNDINVNSRLELVCQVLVARDEMKLCGI